MTGTWYPPAAGTGGFLLDFTNPPFAMTDDGPQGIDHHQPGALKPRPALDSRRTAALRRSEP